MLGIVVLAQGAFGAGKVNQRMIDMVTSGRTQIAIASWWGFDPEDSTDALQAAIDSGARKLVVDNVGKPWIVRPITLASNQEIIFRDGVEVVAKRGEFRGRNDSLFTASARENITLTGCGATLRMHRTDYDNPPYEKAEWRHVLNFRSCTNVKVYGLTLAESGGDGIYLGKASKGVTNKNFHIKDVICDRNYRQGISVITAEDLLIENTIMRDTGGTPPQAGIDFEPNGPDERLVNIVMRNCVTHGNKGDGYEFYLPNLHATSAPVSVRIENCKSIGDNSCGVRIITGNTPTQAVKGRIEFADCTFEESANGGVVLSNMPVGGCKVVFTRCSIINPTMEKPSTTPIVFQSRQGATEPVGGVEFIDCLVRDPIERALISYIDGGGGIPVQAVTGAIDLERDGKRRTIKLTSEQLARWIPASKMKQYPRVGLEGLTLKPRDSGACAFGFARLRREGRFVLYANKGDAVALRVAYQQLGRQAGSPIPVSITSPSDGKIRAPSLPFQQESEVSFTASETGVYRITADPGGNTIRVVSSSHPINISGEGGLIRLVSSAGDYFFRVPAGVREFGVRVSGEGTGEAVRAALIDPSGKVVQEVDNTVQTHQFEVALPMPSKGETWTLRVAKPSAMAWEDHSVDLRGVPPLLAPSAGALLVR